MPKNNSKKHSKLENGRKTSTIELVDDAYTIADLTELLKNPKKLGLLKLYGGFMTGVGFTVGAAVVIVLLGFAVQQLGGVPWIGDLLRDIKEAATG